MDPVPMVVVSEVIEREDEQYTASCPELAVATCGDTVDEARANLVEAVDLYINTHPSYTGVYRP